MSDSPNQTDMFGSPPEWAKDLQHLRTRNHRNHLARLRRIGVYLREAPPARVALDLDTAQDPARVAAWATSDPRARAPRDYQRQRVYGWEQRQPWCERDPIDLNAAAALIEALTGLADVEVLPGHKNTRNAKARMFARVVILPPGMRYSGIVCHEAAHLVGHWGEAHGPVWLRRYCVYLDRAGIVSERIAAASAVAAGLDVAPASTAHECARSMDQIEAGADTARNMTLNADHGGDRHGRA
ncbi:MULTISPECIES: hypothetical protein [unclassified Thiocapsa]|uniref:hypothetical protein n=1 Tax=unclassified Thiocapsa TaxID=2641286 RepID=UPI0035AEC651